MLKAFVLFTLTAAAEICGCYAVYLWLRLQKPAWWLLPGAMSLALFAWLLTLHPQVGARRVYAAYGGVYVAASLAWLWAVEVLQPDRWDVLGSVLCLVGTAVILFGPRSQLVSPCDDVGHRPFRLLRHILGRPPFHSSTAGNGAQRQLLLRSTQTTETSVQALNQVVVIATFWNILTLLA